jgi:hypothetical protein
MAIMTNPAVQPRQSIAQQYGAPRKRGSADAAIDAMTSGAAFDPFARAAAEGQARNAMARRAATAALLAKRGMANEGFGAQIANSTDADIRRQGFDQRLATQMGRVDMQARGAGMALQRDAMEGDQMARAGQLALGEEQLASGERTAAANRGLERSRMDTQAALERERLNQAAYDSSSRNRLAKDELALREKLGVGEQELKSRSLDMDEQKWKDQLGLNQQELSLRRELGLEELSLRSRALSQEEQRFAKQLDLQFKELDLRDKQIMAQIDLGKAEFDQRDKQFLAQLGLSTKAQEWLQKYQGESLKMQADQFKEDVRLRERALDIQNRANDIQLRAVDKQSGLVDGVPESWYQPRAGGSSIDTGSQFSVPQPQQPNLPVASSRDTRSYGTGTGYSIFYRDPMESIPKPTYNELVQKLQDKLNG